MRMGTTGIQSVAAPGTHTPAEAEEAAYKLSNRLAPGALTQFLLESVGPRVTAASLGLADARPLRRWAAGELAPREHAVDQRLRTLFRVVYEITAVFGAATATSFLRSSNPELDDDAPLLVLREDDSDEAAVLERHRRVLAAARAFLEG